MSEWKEVKLGDVCENISKPFDFTNKDKVIFINTGDVLNGKFLHFNYSDKNTLPGQAKKAISKDNILFSEIRPKNKRFVFIDFDNTSDIVVSTKFMVLKSNKKLILPKFLYLLITSPTYLNMFQTIAESRSGTFPQITFSSISNVKIKLPPLPIQKKIADILSVIDEKIETLQNINETLEEMAKAIFKSWFVDFDIVKAKVEGKSDSEIAKEFGISEEIVKLFPSEFVASEIGMIPKGWEVSYLGEKNFSEIIKSGIEKFKGEKIYLATADVDNTQIVNKEIKISYDNRPSRANMQPIHKSIWFAKMKDSKKLLMFDDYSDIDSYILSTGFAGIKTTNLSHNFLWSFIMSDDFEKQKDNLANGAVQIAINNQNIKKIYFVKPTENILQVFNNITSPLFENIYFNTQQIQILQELRDILLPKLINGEIEVDDLEIKGIT